MTRRAHILGLAGRLPASPLAVLAALALAAGCATSVSIDARPTAPTAPTGQELATPLPTAAPSATPSATPSPTPAPTIEPTATPVPAPDLDTAIELYFADVERFWASGLPEVFDSEFVPIARRIPYDPFVPESIPACDGQDGPVDLLAGNAFYCEADDFIAWDEVGLFGELFDSYGDFAVGLVIAHEYGHAVQSRIGEDGPAVFLELQADCLAGAWTASVDSDPANPLRVEATDLDVAIGGFLTFADPPGTGASDPGAHGSAFDRLGAFSEGLDGGIAACVDYLVDPPTSALITFFGPSGGDLELDQLLPLLTGDLDAYLDTLGDERGVDYLPQGDPRQIAAALDAPGCDRRAHEIAFACVAQGSVYIDRAALDRLWDAAGDFAPAYIVAHAYATAYVRRAGVGTAADQVVQADCVVGVWARSVFDQFELPPEDRTHRLLLSTGDLDEGVVGLTSVPAAGVEPGTVGSFERVRGFAAGFFDTYGACRIG